MERWAVSMHNLFAGWHWLLACSWTHIRRIQSDDRKLRSSLLPLSIKMCIMCCSGADIPLQPNDNCSTAAKNQFPCKLFPWIYLIRSHVWCINIQQLYYHTRSVPTGVATTEYLHLHVPIITWHATAKFSTQEKSNKWDSTFSAAVAIQKSNSSIPNNTISNAHLGFIHFFFCLQSASQLCRSLVRVHNLYSVFAKKKTKWLEIELVILE